MELPEFLTINEFGDIRLKGSRIGLYHVIYHHRDEGFDAEQLHEQFPTLSVEQLDEVLRFYAQNRDEVNAYMKRMFDESERLRQQTKPIDWDELRRRMDARRRTESA